MDLQQMRYVIAVAEERNFTRAAARCHIVQSALSHRIKSLEKEIGVELFARTSRKVELTTAGEAFLPAARASLEAADRAVAEASATTGEISGTLTLGIIPTVTAVDLPEVLARFHRTHPGVRIRVRDGSSFDFIDEITRGEMDAAFLGLPDDAPPPAVAHRELTHQRLEAVVAAEHHLANHKKLELADITEEVFADFPADSPGRTQSDIAFASAGLTRDVAFESMNTSLILGLVRRGLAITLQSPEAVHDTSGLRLITVADGPTRNEYLAWSDFNPSPAAQAFVAMLGPEAAAR